MLLSITDIVIFYVLVTMVVCKYFLKGNCRYGNRCYYDHVTPRGDKNSDVGSSYKSNKNYVKPSQFQDQNHGKYSSPFNRQSQQTSSYQQTNKNDKYHWAPTSNRYAPLNEYKNDAQMGGFDRESDDLALIRSVRDEVNLWSSSHMWPYSCFSVGKNNRCVEGLADIQPEELRTLYHLHGNDAYRSLLQEMDAMYAARKQELLQMSEQTKASVLTTVNSNLETNPSSCLSILRMYGPGQDFKSNAAQQQQPTQFTLTSPPLQAEQITAPFSSAEGLPRVKASESKEEPIETQEAAPIPPPITISLFKPDSAPKKSTTSVQDHIYTDKSILTVPELAEFEADSFTLGKIPMRPPPKCFCR